MAGFGDLMQPGGQPGEEPAAGSWSDLVKDPIARSALLGFGLQMMTGGWGNGTQQLAAGLGAGATSAAGTSEAMQKQMEADDKAASTEANHAANRQNQLDIAKLNAQNRAEIASAKIEGMLTRTAMNNAAKTPDEQKLHKGYVDTYLKAAGINPANMSTVTPDLLEKATAWADGELAKRKGGAVPSGPGAGVSPGASPKTGVTGKGAEQGQTGTGVTTGNNTAKNPQNSDELNAALENPGIKQLLATPAGRQELIQRNKEAGQLLVNEYMRRRGGWADGPDLTESFKVDMGK